MVKSITLHTLEKEARKIVELTKASESPNAAKKLATQIEKFEDALFSISYQAAKTPDLKTSGEKEHIKSEILKLLEPKISLLNEESEKVANLLYEICEKAYYLSLVSFI